MELGRVRALDIRWLSRWQQAGVLSAGATTALLLAIAALGGLSPGFVAVVVGTLTAHVVLFAAVARQRATHAMADTDGVITAATAVTVVRGSAAVVLAGFLLAGRPGGLLAWVPALLFGGAVLLDAVDGALARATDTTSAFGARLDVETDAFAVLVGVLVAVRFGQAPAVFIAVGLARYAFLAGLWTRRVRGLAVRELPPRFSRRAIGAVQVAVVFLVISPALGAGSSRLLALAVMVPVLVGFGRDWLLVT